MRDFQDRVAVVTGAASGIGQALAERFAAEGMKVMLADVDLPALETAAGALRDRGADVRAETVDVSRAADVEALAQKTLAAFGAVHVVCNNAGVFAGGLSWEAPLEDYEWVLGVNLWGVIHGVRTFVPILLEQGTEGHLVNTASMAGLTTHPFASIYHLSKHAVLAYSESLYHELVLRGAPIGVSALCPEAVATRIGACERTRPERLRVSAEERSPSQERELVEKALADAVGKGIPPSAIAERVLDAIRERRFYILSDDAWRASCNVRFEDIREGRNPTLAPPVAGDQSETAAS
jgi:NAD(P)-dependent dehydrogenase (short-subunit alcohol dehydrogenase family)